MFNILLVEDNLADKKLLEHLFKSVKEPHRLYFAKDGEEATDFLFRRDKFVDAIRPDLILLDLNMPKKDGRDVLKEVKGDATLRRIPVIVLTTSSNDQDVATAYEFHANSFIQKPRELSELQDVVALIERYWLRTVKLPRLQESNARIG